VLVAPRNPLNIGAAARAMSNFGVSDLRLVNAYDVAIREARSAVKAGAVLAGAREFPDIAHAVADCALVAGTTSLGPRGLEHPLRRLEYAARAMRKASVRGRVALLFGSEKFGLSNEDMSHCHWLLRIPTREEHGSMNLGQAVGICLYELARRSAAARAAPLLKRPAAAEHLERITQFLNEALEESGYIPERTGSSLRLKIRRMVRRLNLNAADAELWQGMLRQVLWKLRAK